MTLRSVVLAGGGTTGHIAPLLATADALRSTYPDIVITVLGAQGGLEEELVPARGYDLRVIPKVAFPRRPNAAAARFPSDFRRALAQTVGILDDAAAQVVVGFGGYVSPPAYLAARRRGVPIVIHEQNARAGLANKLGARFTPFVATTFASTNLPGAQQIGLPMRAEITSLDRAADQQQARAELGLNPLAPTVLVTGGSLGAQRINEAFEDSVATLRAHGVQVVHVTGKGKTFDVPAGDPPYVVLPYVEHMHRCYAAADVVVTRAGAGMVSETSAVGLPAVFVPLPIGNGEQRLNAAELVDRGAALLVDNADFTAEWIERKLIPLVIDHSWLDAMSTATRGWGSTRAAEDLVALIETAARGE